MPGVSRRTFLATTATLVASHARSTHASDSNELSWHDVRDWGVDGRGFDDTESYFD